VVGLEPPDIPGISLGKREKGGQETG